MSTLVPPPTHQHHQRSGGWSVRGAVVQTIRLSIRLRRFLMNRSLATTHGKQAVSDTAVPISKLMLIGALAFIAIAPAIAQNVEMLQKIIAVKQAAAENKRRLRQYQWIETTQLTLKGDDKPSSQKLCQYGPDGQVQKTAIGAPPPPPSGGRLEKRVVANKTADITDYMDQGKDLLTMYE